MLGYTIPHYRCHPTTSFGELGHRKAPRLEIHKNSVGFVALSQVPLKIDFVLEACGVRVDEPVRRHFYVWPRCVAWLVRQLLVPQPVRPRRDGKGCCIERVS